MSRLEIRLARQKRIRSFKGILSTVILTTSLLSGMVFVQTTIASASDAPAAHSVTYEYYCTPAEEGVDEIPLGYKIYVGGVLTKTLLIADPKYSLELSLAQGDTLKIEATRAPDCIQQRDSTSDQFYLVNGYLNVNHIDPNLSISNSNCDKPASVSLCNFKQKPSSSIQSIQFSVGAISSSFVLGIPIQLQPYLGQATSTQTEIRLASSGYPDTSPSNPGWVVNCASGNPVVETSPSPLELGLDETASLVVDLNCPGDKNWMIQMPSFGEYEIYSAATLQIGNGGYLIVARGQAYTIKNKNAISTLNRVILFIQGTTTRPQVQYTSLAAPTIVPPNPATNLTFSVLSSSSVNLSWTASSTPGVTYSVSVSPTGPTCTVASSGSGTTASCFGQFVSGQEYTFTVKSAKDERDSTGVTTKATPNPGENNPPSQRPPTQTNPTPTINLPSNGGSTGGVGTASTEPGQVFTLTGSGMNNVNTVNVGSQRAVITLKTATKLGFKIPKNLPAGLHDLSLYGSFGSMTEAKFFSIAKKKIKTRALGFAGNSPALTSAQKSEMRIFLNKLPGKVTLVCNGSTSSPTVTAFDKKLARDRAREACDYARELNPSLQTEIRITPAAGVGYKYRSVKLTLKNY